MASTNLHPVSRTASFICASCLKTLRRPERLCRYGLSATSAKYSSAARGIPPRSTSTRNDTQSRRNARPLTIPNLPNYTRHYATESTATISQSAASVTANGLVRLSNRRLISLSGADAPKFLQGLVTNNVDPSKWDPFYSAFLDARGRVLWDVFVWPKSIEEQPENEWACLIEVDADEVPSVLRHLKKHKLRSKIKIRTVEGDEYAVWAAWGSEAQAVNGYAGSQDVFQDPRAEGFGLRLLRKVDSGETASAELDADTQQYDILRYLLGIPEGQKEIARESALPMEYNIDLAKGIDFKKGCYVGQELTIRTKHTGVVRKRILPVQLYRARNGPLHDAPPSQLIDRFDPQFNESVPAGADIKQLDESGSIKKGRSAGKLIASIGNVGLALCRLEMMTPMRISAEGGSYKPGMEFGMQLPDAEGAATDTIRVKAFVPEWLKEREMLLWSKGRKSVVQDQ